MRCYRKKTKIVFVGTREEIEFDGKARCWLPTTLYIIAQIAGFIASVQVWEYMLGKGEILFKLERPGQDMSIPRQMIRDWQTEPLVKLSVEDDLCPLGTEPLFRKYWSGIKDGCYMT